SNLDAKLRVQMRIEISKLHQRLETTIIYVTHDQTEALTLGTRIVVMKDGIVQQVASPLDLYMRPDNLFVAGFIGSPQMNFVDAKVVVSGTDVLLMFGSNSVKLPADKAKKLIEAGYRDKVVTFGIRPEDIKDEEMFISNSPDTAFDATVRVYEMLGAEVFLYFTVDDAFDITVRVNPRTTARPGDTIRIALDGSKIHLFDKETQRTICN
ncbi:MAG: TOBE domain-containing protein, partial [Eubacterium sp.]|nr:TOBE domain-containing protein [Eubacterium sp.]